VLISIGWYEIVCIKCHQYYSFCVSLCSFFSLLIVLSLSCAGLKLLLETVEDISNVCYSLSLQCGH